MTWLSKGLVGIAFSLMVLSPLSGRASTDVKIGIVDVQRALVEVKEGSTAKAKLQKEVSSKQDALKAKEAAIKKDVTNFQKQSGVLSDKAKQKKQAELQQRIMTFQQEASQTQMQLQDKEKSMTQPILKKLKDVITDYATKNKFTLVLERNESGVVFTQNIEDITEEIIKAYDSKN